ncbi:MAG: ExeM/NucH family extracellular endonuclease, partial [Acidimicrobiia bacterium]
MRVKKHSGIGLGIVMGMLASLMPVSLVAQADVTAIHDIQGSGSATPMYGDTVTVSGVVVGDFQGNAFAGDQLSGFYVQEEPADWDADPATSEGIFVYAPYAPDVAVGDLVEVTGRAGEYSGQTQISGYVTVTKTGTAVEAVVTTPVTLPMDTPASFERYEGMSVTFDQDLYISEFFNFDRFGEIVLSTDRQYQPTQVAEPGSAEAEAIAQANSLSRITLDDGRNSQNPDPAIHPNGEEFTLTNTFRGGDILRSVTGVMGQGFGLYRIQPTQGATYVNANPRPTSPDPVGGEVKVASFNVLNFFTSIDDGSDDCGPTGNLECRGADNATELERQMKKLVAGIIALDADVVGLEEVENDIRSDDGSRAHDAILTLVERLNAVAGTGTWAWVGETNHYNDYPIRNEIIYRPDKVTPVGPPIALADPAFDATRPGDIEPVGRPPLAQTFRAASTSSRRSDQRPFTVVVNHFKSKGSSCASIGDPDTGDGQANCNLTRVAQAEALLGFVDTLQDDSSGVLVVGDLNSYTHEDPIQTLEDGGLTDVIGLFGGDRAYSYVFDGQ